MLEVFGRPGWSWTVSNGHRTPQFSAVLLGFFGGWSVDMEGVTGSIPVPPTIHSSTGWIRELFSAICPAIAAIAASLQNCLSLNL